MDSDPRTSTPHSLEPDPVEVRRLDVVQIVAKVAGAAPTRVNHCPFGHSNVTFSAEVGDRTLIVRTNDDPAPFRLGVHDMDRLRELGLPVPAVLAVDVSMSAFNFAYMVTDAFDGRDLRDQLPSMSDGQQRTVARQVAGFELRVGTLPEGDGFGFGHIGMPAPHRNWGSVVAAEIDRARRSLAPDDALLDRVLDAVRATDAYLVAVRPTCFLDDLTTKNVIVSDTGALVGIIDVDAVCFGDPLFQVGLTQTAITADLSGLPLVYVEELCMALEVTTEQRRMVDLYSAVFALSFLGRAEAASPAANALTSAFDRWLGTGLPNERPTPGLIESGTSVRYGRPHVRAQQVGGDQAQKGDR